MMSMVETVWPSMRIRGVVKRSVVDLGVKEEKAETKEK
jgi:hypothetical protein